ncbi:Clr5 domain-containing protein [Rhexocercosporidium sp. MPI-PUGE-AT-0058]|nr:Clr5 domain-containing protein [Rhexocercosporidium sp. MPI-PUGE-AT-0058]
MAQRTETTDALPSEENPSRVSILQTKTPRLERSDAKWDSHKEEIYQLYVDQNMTLKETMDAMETNHGFKASLRKWKMKIKEWKFEKNLPANEMKFIAAKADKRKAEDGKETIFFRGNIMIGLERLRNFKKRKLTAVEVADLPILVDTPPNITYLTPKTSSEELQAPPQAEPDCKTDSYANEIESVDTPPHFVSSSPETAQDGAPNSLRTGSRKSTSSVDRSSTTGSSFTGSIPKSLDGPDILFNCEGIRKLVQGTPARPFHLNSFLAILRRSSALATNHEHAMNSNPCLMYEGKIVERNTSFVKSHIRLVVQYAQDFLQDLRTDQCLDIEQKGNRVEKDLLALQEHLRLASRDESRKLVFGAAAQYYK